MTGTITLMATYRGAPCRRIRYRMRKERVSRAKQTTMHRQVHALIALLLLVWFQVLWFTGSSLLGSLHKPPADEANLFEQSLISKGVIPREPRGGTSPSPSPTSTPLQPEIQQGALAEYVFWTFQRSATVEGLDNWSGVVDPTHFLAPKPEPSPKGKITSNINELPFELVDWQDSVTLRAKNLNDLLQQLILPLLYGCVGAMAYVLRTLSQLAKDRLYRTENDAVWDLRISLGILAGLAIGWFFKPSGVEVTGIGLVSPFALAFVAGYSVDLLFTAMDRIVAAFSGPYRVPEALPSPAAQGQKPPTVQGQPKPAMLGQAQPPEQVQPKPATQERPQN